MSIEILADRDTGKACFACNTSDTVFGPLFASEHHWQEMKADSDVRVYGAGT